MGCKATTRCKPSPTKTRSVLKENASIGISSVQRTDGLFSVDCKETDIQLANETHQATFALISIDKSLRRQFFANDSLGG